MQTQKRVDQQLQLIKPEEFRKRLQDTEDIVSKSYSKEMMDELLQHIKTTQEQLESKVSKFYAEFEDGKEKSGNKLDEFGKKQLKLSERIDNTNTEVTEVKNEIKRIRQAGANNSNIRKRLTDMENADRDDSKRIDSEAIDELFKVQDTVRDLVDQVNEIATSGVGKKSKGNDSTAVKDLENRVFAHIEAWQAQSEEQIRLQSQKVIEIVSYCFEINIVVLPIDGAR